MTNTIKNLVEYKLNSRKESREAKKKKLFNIISFSELDRKGLQHGIIERRVLLHQNNKEKVYIQYPGKESPEKPWDFRPKAENNNNFIPDLSFSNIWDDISQIHINSTQVIDVIAAIFVRMAYLIDYILEDNEYDYEDIDIKTNKVVSKGKIKLKWYRPNFDKSVIQFLSKKISIRGISIESYLIYNDLLAQNEDCKYYYMKKIKKEPWKPNVGRQNTLFSHLSVIQFITKQIPFSTIMTRFTKGRGVAPIKIEEIDKATGNIISTKKQ